MIAATIGEKLETFSGVEANMMGAHLHNDTTLAPVQVLAVHWLGGVLSKSAKCVLTQDDDYASPVNGCVMPSWGTWNEVI